MTPEDFRKIGYQVIDWIADYRENVGTYSVMSSVPPGSVKKSLPASPPEGPQPFDEFLEDLNQIILPAVTHWNHPDYFAYFPSNAS